MDSLSNPQEDLFTAVCPLVDEPYVLLGCASGKLHAAALLGSSGSPAGGAREASSLQKLPYDGEPCSSTETPPSSSLYTQRHCQSQGGPRLCPLAFAGLPSHDAPRACCSVPRSNGGSPRQHCRAGLQHRWKPPSSHCGARGQQPSGLGPEASPRPQILKHARRRSLRLAFLTLRHFSPALNLHASFLYLANTSVQSYTSR